MTYDEYAKQRSGDDYVPPPMPSPAPSSMGGLQLGGYGDWPKPGVSLAQIMLPPGVRKFLGPRETTNPSFSPMAGGQPSFSVPPGEKTALQMPGVRDAMTRAFQARERLMNLADPQQSAIIPPPNLGGFFANPPPGLRDMPRSPERPFFGERNTEIIPGPPPPNFTPYPLASQETRSQWLQVPLDGREIPNSELRDFRPGMYPDPANRQMPEAYDTRTSGGFLADAGRAAARGVAGQPLAQMYAPMQNVTNAMMLAEAAKTDDERARDRMRPVLDEYAQKALEPLMMRKYAEKMGYMPTPGVWKRIWRAIVENYSQSDDGLARGRGTPAPR